MIHGKAGVDTVTHELALICAMPYRLQRIFPYTYPRTLRGNERGRWPQQRCPGGLAHRRGLLLAFEIVVTDPSGAVITMRRC